MSLSSRAPSAKRWSRASALAGALAVPLVACSFLVDLGSYQGGARSPSDASDDADADADAAAVPACSLDHLPPQPPPGSIGSVDTGGSVTFALSTFGFDPGRDQSIDLDGRCTSCEACRPRAGATHCGEAEPGGRDNGGGPIFGTLFGLADGGSIGAIQSGTYGLLLRIDHWSGEADDGAVGVTLLPSTLGLAPADDGGARARANDGADPWLVDRAPDAGAPPRTSNFGFVQAATLYAHFDSVEFSIGKVRFAWRDAWLRGKLTPGAHPQRIERAAITARWPADTFATSLQTYYSKYGFCESPEFARARATDICRSADVPLPGDPATAPCGAVSVTFTFSAVESQIAAEADADPGLFPCGADFRVTCPE